MSHEDQSTEAAGGLTKFKTAVVPYALRHPRTPCNRASACGKVVSTAVPTPQALTNL